MTSFKVAIHPKPNKLSVAQKLLELLCIMDNCNTVLISKSLALTARSEREHRTWMGNQFILQRNVWLHGSASAGRASTVRCVVGGSRPRWGTRQRGVCQAICAVRQLVYHRHEPDSDSGICRQQVSSCLHLFRGRLWKTAIEYEWDCSCCIAAGTEN